MPNLDQMDLTALNDLQNKLQALDRAGRLLFAAGMVPTFAVSAWAPAMTVPPLGEQAGQVSRHAELGKPIVPPRLCKDGPRTRLTITEPVAEDLTQPQAADTPTADMAPMGQEEPAPLPTVEAPALAAGDDPAASIPELPAVEVSPAPPGKPSDTLKPPSYTEEETTWAITTYVDLIEAGRTQKDVVQILCSGLGRSADSVTTRIYTIWKRRIQDERDRRATARAKPIAVSPATKPAPQPEATPAEPPRSIYEDPLVQHVSAIKMPPQWDYGADRRMLLLAVGGVDAKTIAANLEVSPKLVTARLAALTEGGRYAASDLLGAVTAILGEQRKGVAA